MRRKEREVTSLAEIEAIIAGCDVCRIALNGDKAPYIVAMNFGYRSGKPPLIYFHSAPEGRKIDLISRDNRVAFQMDSSHLLTTGKTGCDFSMKYRSVVGEGRIYIVDSEEERNAGLNIVMQHYTGRGDYGFRPKTMAVTTILRLEVESLSAKQVI